MAETTFESTLLRRLRDRAVGYPEVNEGSSCVNRAFKARKKNFLFLGEKPDNRRIMLKLGPSLDEAEGVVGGRDGCTVGTNGWVTLNLAADGDVDAKLLERWVEESYRLLAPKTLVKQLDAG